MSIEVLLDRQGDLPALPHHQVIATEVDFLHHATNEGPLLIRGERLCAWAEAFYRLRGRPCRHQESLSVVLQRVFPALLREQTELLAHKMDLKTVFSDQVSVASVLSCCYPDDYSLWQSPPSRKHAARWLLWLYTHQPDAVETIMLTQFADSLKQQVIDAPESILYEAITYEQARAILLRWLGAADEKLPGLREFPLEVPVLLLAEIKSAWRKRLIESKGAYFAQMLAFPLSIALRQELARLTAQFYETNAPHLTRDRLRQLHPYLDTQTLGALEDQLKLPEPAALPEMETAVLDWFQTQYLPYRRWQARFGDESARERIIHHAQAFAHWYLSRYPHWLLEGNWLSFQQTAHLRQLSLESLVLCVILDGLPAWDAENFAQAVSARIERLQLQQKTYCFAPLPTVTEFAKDALLKGLPPRLASQYPPLGHILPDNVSPKKGLKEAKSGEIVFWRVEQPDKAYHFVSEDKRERQVRAELDGILQALEETVKSVPDRIPLQIIITSDHGRLLNPKSPRCLSIPVGTQAHGRVAWGRLEQGFDERGFMVEEDANRVAVYGERFEMAYDMLIAWGEESFQNVKTGSEPYPHGGLFPEEVIVPWFVFVRDAACPDLKITIDGKGEAGNAGLLTVKIVNSSHMALECLAVMLSHGAQATVEWSILPMKDPVFNISITPCPTKTELQTLKATLLFRQPNGATFDVEAALSLEVSVLYERDDSLFKDLEL